jgi:hypothetical protein
MLSKNNDMKPNCKVIEKHKLLPKSNGLYNLTYLKTHLQDEGVLDDQSMIAMIERFKKTLCIC